MIQAALAELLEGRPLSREQAREVMDEIMRGEATQAQIGGFLIALRLKGETADEIAGCAEAMRDHVLPVRPERDDLVDTAGTGGDGASTINISTAAAIVAASAGAGVAKHGNRAVSSASGSADVLEALGFQLEQPPERIAQSIDELGFGFMFAPAHHPAMRHAAPVRRELATRTVFNVLGPLTNPAGARAQVIGVYSPSLVRTLAEVLAQLGARRAFVVHGAHGIDELSPAGPNDVCEVVDGEVRERVIDPIDLGIPRCDPAELRGGSPAENAQAIREVFAGADGGRRNAIILNAAGAIAASGHAEDLRDGVEIARLAIDSGAATQRVDELARFTHAVLGRARRPGARRDRRDQAAVALARRHPSGCGSRPTRVRIRPRRSGGRVGARGRALRRRLGRSSRRARSDRRPFARQGLLLDRGASAHGEGGGGRCRAAAAP
jgi:anthranilate phosphoribosyltransferase